MENKNSTVEEEKKIIPEEKKVENISYTNPLLQTLTTQDLTKENFPRYKKDMENILLKLLGEMAGIGVQLTEYNIANQERTKDILLGAEKQSKLLREYCIFEKKDKNIPLSYKYLGSIAHKTRPIAGTIKAYILNYKNTTQDKHEFFLSLKNIIQDISIPAIQKIIDTISEIKYDNETIHTAKIFSPYNITKEKIKQINNKEIQIQNTLDKDLSINSYEDIFELVMDNLIANAVKFTPNKGEITIGMEEEGDNNITFFVKDNGIGIPSDKDPYTHGYTTPSPEGKEGTGLGLSHCKSFLKEVDGSIRHENKTPQGTIFYFTLKKNTTKTVAK